MGKIWNKKNKKRRETFRTKGSTFDPRLLMHTPCYYKGESDEFYTKGKMYHIMCSGEHWHRDLGFGVWVTTDEYTKDDGWDEDYGVFFTADDFFQYFFI